MPFHGGILKVSSRCPNGGVFRGVPHNGVARNESPVSDFPPPLAPAMAVEVMELKDQLKELKELCLGLQERHVEQQPPKDLLGQAAPPPSNRMAASHPPLRHLPIQPSSISSCLASSVVAALMPPCPLDLCKVVDNEGEYCDMDIK